MKTDWIIHIVPDEVTGLLSGHTHGLDKWGSLEIEINLHLRPEILGQYLNLVASHIAYEGIQIEDGERVTGIFNCPIYFFKTKSVQSEDIVLRAVLPDENLWFPWDTYNGERCKPNYVEQIAFNTFKVWYVVVDFQDNIEMNEHILSRSKGILKPNFCIDKSESLRVITTPYMYLTSKSELFTTGLLDSFNLHNQLVFLEESLKPNKMKVFCKDAAPEQIEKLQRAVHLRDDEL
jgi:hypothetical protein